MQVTAANAAPYLLTRRLIDPEVVIDGDFVAIDASRRNRNIKVQHHDGSGLFLKQIQSAEMHDIAALEREAACYRLPGRHESLGPLKGIMPDIRHYDSAARILTLHLIANGENLHLYQQRTGGFPVSIAESLGSALATLHAVDVRAALPEETLSRLFLQQPPWILGVHQMRPNSLGNDVSAANRQLFDLVQRYPTFAESLEAIRTAWTRNRLIHGDLKWDNCVITWPDGSDGAPRVVFADWELADLGDPAWDVGAMLQTWLVPWIQSIPVAPGAAPRQLTESAGVPLPSMQPALRAFWTTYAERRALAADEREDFAERAVRSAGARMIQTAYESLATLQQLTPQMILLLQVSLNVLTRPQQARRELFALS